MEGMFARYTDLLERYPVRTEMLTSALIWFAGDILAQTLEMRATKKGDEKTCSAEGAFGDTNKDNVKAVAMPSAVDWKRTCIQTCYAALLWAPLGHHWYALLDRLVIRVADAGTRSFVVAKLALEMVALHPVALALFFVGMGLMGGEAPFEICAQMKRDYAPSLMAEYVMWTPIDLANFALVPVRHQLLVVNLGCLVESIMLSFVKANGFRLPGHYDGDGDGDWDRDALVAKQSITPGVKEKTN